jgi:hypothetical protein
MWARDQPQVQDAEITWLGQRRQLLIHEKAQIRRCQTKAIEARMQMLTAEDGARITGAALGHIVWIDQDGWEHETEAPSVEWGEGPDRLQFTLEDWIDQERQ